jgi:peroxiredoxin Q/BCP
MRTPKLALLSPALVLFASVSFAQTGTPEVGLKPGDPAPPFSLQGSDGKTHSLSGLKGKPVVVAWFPKAFTTGCTIECKSLKEGGEQIRNYDVAYFAASVDDAPTNKKFAESLEVDFPILSDPEKSVAKAYGVLGDAGFARRWTFYIGPDGKIQYVDKEIKPQTAAADMSARLQELKVPKK